MGVFSELGNPAAFGNLGAIPKSNDAYKILVLHNMRIWEILVGQQEKHTVSFLVGRSRHGSAHVV